MLFWTKKRKALMACYNPFTNSLFIYLSIYKKQNLCAYINLQTQSVRTFYRSKNAVVFLVFRS